MSARVVPGMAASAEISSFQCTDIGARRRRRALAAFLTGSALFVASTATVISEGASASGAGIAIYNDLSSAFQGDDTPFVAHFVSLPLDAPVSPRKQTLPSGAGAARHFSSRRPVCVRLCDGFFFPASEPAGANDEASEQAMCSALCPDAPTALYYQPSGSDKIEDAISTSGGRYSALPSALRYRSKKDDACACQHETVREFDPLNDATLRKGDALMTASGFVVFQGDERAAHARGDFSALGAAPLPKERMAALRAMERVSVLNSGGVAHSGFAAAEPPPRPVANRQTADNTIRFVEAPGAATN